jgi:uncharacterized flavoprotein (TIGR03862 family)
MAEKTEIAIIGGGPAGLIAAEWLAKAGRRVTLYERMPSLGRKFLMAGRGGLNLTHSDPLITFLDRYRPVSPMLDAAIEAFSPDDLGDWANELGAELFIGSSGRVFPKAMKASPLLRAWLARLAGLGVTFRLRHAWQGWDESGALVFATPEGEVQTTPAATLLALGGASWPRLGADGGWVKHFEARGIPVAPLEAANCGMHIQWSEHLIARHVGEPLKRVALSLDGRMMRGEAVISRHGLEGGAVYALSRLMRERLSSGEAVEITLDLRPDLEAGEIASAFTRTRAGDSTANRIRKAAGLSPAAIGVLREAGPFPSDPTALAKRIKALPLSVTGMSGLERAISTAGGVRFNALDAQFMLKAMPGVFVAGEMLDWEAPTGGYLLQACFATGVAAAKGALAYTN